MINAQIIGFKEDMFLLQPGKKVPFRAPNFDVAEASVAKYMTTNAYLHLILMLDVGGQHFKVFFEFGFSFGHQS